MFDDRFFKAIGLDKASPEQKAQLSEQLAEMVQNRVAQRLAEVLTEEQADHFTALNDSGKEEEAFAYLEQTYPEYAALLQEEVEEVESLLLRDMQSVVQSINQNDSSDIDDAPHAQTTTEAPLLSGRGDKHHSVHHPSDETKPE